jgi:TfoX/Sxy family transcriptional regulator of competence genes
VFSGRTADPRFVKKEYRFNLTGHPMASNIDFVKFIIDQIGNAGVISYRKMFGEYAVYCDKKVIALICDNQFYVKPTDSGRSFMEDVLESPPYPGARNYFLIEDRIDDREWMCELVRRTARELPEPKVKKQAQKKSVKNKKAGQTGKNNQKKRTIKGA